MPSSDGNAFGFALVKITLIILNSLVLFGLLFVLVVIAPQISTHLIVFLIIIAVLGANFLAAVIGAFREHRLTVLTTGSVTLIMLLLALFTRDQRHQNNMYSLMYFLAIVILSFAYSAMLRQRAFGALNAGVLSRDANADGLTTIVVYHPPNALQPQPNGFVAPHGDSSDFDAIFKDPPPSYTSDMYPPPPKYEDICQTSQK